MAPEPSRDCPLCPRLVAYSEDMRAAHPTGFDVFGRAVTLRDG